jgi:predicted Zn-dependent peptidase
MYRDEPSSHVQELLNQRYWHGHPLGRPLTGTLESITAFQRQDFLDYRVSHYHAASYAQGSDTGQCRTDALYICNVDIPLH